MTVAAKVKDAPVRMLAVVGLIVTETESVGGVFGGGSGVLELVPVLPQEESAKAARRNREVGSARRMDQYWEVDGAGATDRKDRKRAWES